jgi:hypothetical protein
MYKPMLSAALRNVPGDVLASTIVAGLKKLAAPLERVLAELEVERADIFPAASEARTVYV